MKQLKFPYIQVDKNTAIYIKILCKKKRSLKANMIIIENRVEISNEVKSDLQYNLNLKCFNLRNFYKAI